MMSKIYLENLRPKLDEINSQKLAAIVNPRVIQFLIEAVELCNSIEREEGLTEIKGLR